MGQGDGIRRRVPLLLVLAFLFTFLGPACIQPFLKNFLPKAWPSVKVTSILAALYFSFAFWRMPVVWTQRIIGDKWSFVLGVASYLLVPVALVFDTPYALLVILAAVWGWGAACIWQTGPVWLYDNTDPRRRGLWAGIIYAATLAGLLVGVLVIGHETGLAKRSAALAAAIVPGFIAVTAALFLPSRRARAEGLSLRGVFAMFFDRRVLVIGALLFVSASTYGLLLGTFRDRTEAAFGAEAVGKSAACFFAVRLMVCLLAGHFSDLFARRYVVAIAFLAGGLGLAASSASASLYSFYAAGICLGIVGAVVPVSATAFSADWFAPERRTLAMGAAFIWNDMGTALTLLAAPLLAQKSGSFAGVMFAFSAVFVASTALAFALPRSHGRPAAQGAT